MISVKVLLPGMRTVCLCTLGCKLNQAETEELKEKFEAKGLKIVEPFERADIYIINACAVTQKAEKETRQLVSQIKRVVPKTYLVVIGCFTPSLRLNREIAEKVDKWIENKNKEKIDKLILGQIVKNIGPSPTSLPPKARLAEGGGLEKGKNKLKKKTRAFIKIQDGCQNYCSYCIVPYLRKEILNKPLQKIIQEIKNKEKNGCQEIVLVGTNIGNYRTGECDLNGLLRKILDKTAIKRIRLSSLWPTSINPEFVKLIQDNPRICPHLHLSIQSASDKILKAMGRNYTNQDLRKIVKNLRQIPNLNLTADIIVGFPGETESDFKQTANFVKEAKFIKVHIFRFSPRAGTRAYSADNQISEKIKKIRSKKLNTLSIKVGQSKKKKYLKQVFPVLFEHQQAGYWQGFTPNYLKVFTRSDRDLANKIIQVKLGQLYKDGLKAEID